MKSTFKCRPAATAVTLVALFLVGYYDGNTVTALWNYAQHFAMSDNFYQTTFGSFAPGHINLISGQTHGLRVVSVRDAGELSEQLIEGPMIANLRPALEDCFTAGENLAEMTGRNVGDLLNAKGITWGWFHGGFRPTARNADGTAVCDGQHTSVSGSTEFDYTPRHEPFQYYASTANPHHLSPTSVAMIGHTDQANHQYDLSDFWAA